MLHLRYKNIISYQFNQLLFLNDTKLGHIDVSLLEPGVVDFNRLNDAYMIVIAPFDLWGFGRYRYTFRMKCDQEPSLYLGDGATRIFLNTRGTNPEGVSQELIDFLHYVEDSSDKKEKERQRLYKH